MLDCYWSSVVNILYFALAVCDLNTLKASCDASSRLSGCSHAINRKCHAHLEKHTSKSVSSAPEKCRNSLQCCSKSGKSKLFCSAYK